MAMMPSHPKQPMAPKMPQQREQPLRGGLSCNAEARLPSVHVFQSTAFLSLQARHCRPSAVAAMVTDVISACYGCRPENHKEAKRKREEIKWESGSAQKSKKSRSDRAASRDREHKHKHKEKCVPDLPATLPDNTACRPCLHVRSSLASAITATLQVMLLDLQTG